MSNDAEERAPRPVTQIFVDHARRPRNLGELERADGVGEYAHGCGDTVKVFLEVRDGVITRVRYLPRSCVNTLACISLASTMIEGRSPLAARRNLTPEVIIDALECLPLHEHHCAEIAARAIWAAVDDYLRNCREPWRRLYR